MLISWLSIGKDFGHWQPAKKWRNPRKKTGQGTFKQLRVFGRRGGGDNSLPRRPKVIARLPNHLHKFALGRAFVFKNTAFFLNTQRGSTRRGRFARLIQDRRDWKARMEILQVVPGSVPAQVATMLAELPETSGRHQRQKVRGHLAGLAPFKARAQKKKKNNARRKGAHDPRGAPIPCVVPCQWVAISAPVVTIPSFKLPPNGFEQSGGRKTVSRS